MGSNGWGEGAGGLSPLPLTGVQESTL